MVVDLSIIPMGLGVSISPEVAKVIKIIDQSGIPYSVTPMGTVLEGDWDAVMNLVRRCHDEVLKNSERVYTKITIDDRKGKSDRLRGKVASLEAKVGKQLP
ncbi:MAG: MTH1187 family thiamine-binding protein [bacterium]|nr:MTH1187 family thiamine-binding protein [bacterium]